MRNTLNSNANRSHYLPFDRAQYDAYHLPCQALALSFFSTGIMYCVKTKNGIHMPVTKNAVKARMEKGVFAWVDDPKLIYIDSAPGQFFCLEFSRQVDRYNPAIQNSIEFEEAFAREPYFNSFKKASCRIYLFNESRGKGNNIPVIE